MKSYPHDLNKDEASMLTWKEGAKEFSNLNYRIIKGEK